MTHPRLIPANGRVAAQTLRGQVEAERYVAGAARRVSVPVADLLRAPGGKRDRQLLMGADVTVYEERDGFAFVQAGRDGYVGYVAAGALAQPLPATHWVSAPATHIYSAPDFKSPELCRVTFGALLTVERETGRFSGLKSGGFVPASHLLPIAKPFSDPATAAQLFEGVPYLWGGNSHDGIDCSGLIQAACFACGLTCPGDSDMQERVFGEPATDPHTFRRNDLLFWAGHVALVLDGETLVHANVHHMTVVREGISAAVRRIEEQGGGQVTSYGRIIGAKV